LHEKKRARRIRDRKRLKKLWLRRGRMQIWVGRMYATRGKTCSKAECCGNRRAYDGPSIGDLRRMSADDFVSAPADDDYGGAT
jgi:hypothetical protein